jgi:drug/metabolite transporter (DMT)-like permease
MTNIQTISGFFPSLMWTILSGFFLTVGDLLLRSWIAHPWSYGFWVSFAVYIVSIFLAMMSFFGENIAIATLLIVMLNSITYLVATYYFYGDTIETRQIIGVFIGFCAIFLLKSH